MSLVLIAVVVVAVVAVLAFLLLRPRGGDLDSVRSYHSALGTLEHLSERSGPSSVQVVGPAGEPPALRRSDPGPARRRDVPPVPVRGSDGFPDPGTPLVFDDARPTDRHRSHPAHEGAGPAPADRAQRHALESMNRRPRRATTVAAAVAVVAVFAVLAYVGSGRSKPAGHASSATTGGSSTGATRQTASHSPSHPASHTAGHGGTGTRPAKRRTTTPTTAPSRIVAVSAAGTTATYPVTTTAYQLAVTASGPCWVQVTSTSTGATLWAGTLEAGARQVVSASGVVTLDLGAPDVTLTVNRVPVVFPTPMHTPFQATFQPTAAESTTATTTTAATTTTTAASTGSVSTG